MTTSTDFETQLDDNPADWTLRSVYADWLEEQGNPRADSQRWMVANGRRGEVRVVHYAGLILPWTIHLYVFAGVSKCLTGKLFNELIRNTFDYTTRIAAEIDLHNALVKAGKIQCALIEEVEA